MENDPQTWHYGLIAKWWSEFNDDFRPHEIPYFQRYIERDGQPVLAPPTRPNTRCVRGSSSSSR